MMKKRIISILLILGLLVPVMGKSRKVVIKIMETTDVHGNFFGYNFKENHPLEGGFPQVSAYVNSQRDSLGKENCILIDAGDILQGQPCVYYTNFIDTNSPHLTSETMNFMGYDAAAFGNHDIEAGHPVFNRWVADCKFPVLGANIISKATGEPYAKPYCIIEREGVKIAILGMVTPAIPMWLPEKLWQGLQFEDMVKSARKWVPLILEKEKPDVVVNFAAESHVDRSITDPEAFVRTNVMGTTTLLDACREFGIKRFHQVSTDEVYGDLPLDRPDLFFTEETPLHTSSPYSSSKASADLFVLAYHRTYGLPVTISRCSNNYGPYHFPEKLIPLMIANALADKPLPVYGEGLNVRDWLYVEDHCKAIDLIIHKGRVGEVYNIGGHNEMKNIDIVKLICKELGKPESLITHVTDRKGHDMRYAIDPTKIHNELGWLPETKFADGIKKTIKWYLENREWWETIISGEYQNYYEKMYSNR